VVAGHRVAQDVGLGANTGAFNTALVATRV